jgi:small subunit ribosomal protein S14
MATTAKRVKDARKPKFSSASTTAASSADVRARSCASSASAACASAALALKGEIPGVVKSSW